MPTIEQDEKKLPIAGQMAANADPSKRDAFMKGFMGKKDDESDKSDKMEAMKRRYGQSS